MLMTTYECKSFYVYILALVIFIIKILHVLLDSTTQKTKQNQNKKKDNLYIRGYREYVVNAHGSWF